MITFGRARQIVAESPELCRFYGPGFAVAEYGWQNDNLFVIGVNSASGPVFDAPDLLVDKRTGELRIILGSLGRDPAPDLMPIGDVP